MDDVSGVRNGAFSLSGLLGSAGPLLGARVLRCAGVAGAGPPSGVPPARRALGGRPVKGHDWRSDVVLAASLCELAMANEAFALSHGDPKRAALCADLAQWESSIAFSLACQAYGVKS